MPKKKLIEVALPLDAINAAAAHEKSVPRRGHPATLHLWWARRPLALARAVLFSQLVDDPSAHADEYRLDAVRAQVDDVESFVNARIESERQRLFDLMTKMVAWENMGDDALFDAARAEIRASTDNNPPVVLDPFTGGGTIPLEAQRLGLEVQASDLNPVAVLITKALVEFPPRFAGRAPIFGGAAAQRNAWPGASGLAEDVRQYGAWMRAEAERRLGHNYPKAKLDDGSSATVVAWIWARTVRCSNPACGLLLPLARTWSLSKKKGREARIVPTVIGDEVEYSIAHGPTSARHTQGTIARGAATCLKCQTLVPVEYIREEAQAGRMGAQLCATVAEGSRRRIYLAPSSEQRLASEVERPVNVPEQLVTTPNHDVDRLPMYGMPRWSDAFTARQLTSLTSLSDLIAEARNRVLDDARAAGLEDGYSLEERGTGAVAYADTVATFLAFAVSKVADWSSSICSWIPQIEGIRDTFPRQAVAMTWDFAEVNILSNSVGNISGHLSFVADAIDRVPAEGQAIVTQADAMTRPYKSVVVSTDPPYYDNIGYSDLSDFFYVWMRRSLGSIYPKLLSTLLVPKSEELVANASRHGGRREARDFFEEGFKQVFRAARAHASMDYPITVYYAFKQSESDVAGEVSTGWETILSGIIESGWTVTATWPMRSERASRMVSIGTNALASAIVLALRPRPEGASVIDRRGFVAELRSVLPDALRDLQLESIAPVDLAQASIGPGVAVYSKYAEVIEPNGARMPVRAALQQINAILAEVLSAQEGDFDAESRWCVSWFEGRGFEEGPYGEAEVLASAKGSSVEGIRRSGVLTSRAGKVALLAPQALPSGYDPRDDDRATLWEVVMHLAREMSADGGGVEGAGRLLARAEERGLDTTAVHELAYLLFSICERKGWAAPGILFNAVGGSWPEIRAAANEPPRETGREGDQLSFDLSKEF